MDVVALDIETTGLDWNINEIIEVGVVRVTEDLQHEIVRFGCKIKIEHMETASPVALKVNGWNEADWANAPDRRFVLAIYWSLCQGAKPLGHNARRFDVPFLNATFSTMGLPPPWGTTGVIDTMELCRPLKDRGDIQSQKLDACCAYFNIPRQEPHRALDDTVATLEVARILARNNR